MKPLHKIQTREELIKRRENSHVLMATLAALFFVWLIVIYITSNINLGYLGFVFLFLSMLKYVDMRYYDLIIREDDKNGSIQKEKEKKS